jgi:glycosyltransferase involved in cell wall biosynthesis
MPTDILFLHNNFPGQFRLMSEALAERKDVRVHAISSARRDAHPSINRLFYTVSPQKSSDIHPFARRFESECRRAEQIVYSINRLKAAGVRPKLVVAHSGWGEALPLRLLLPEAKICLYCEFYYRTEGQDVGFDPEFPRLGIDGEIRVALRNATAMLSLADCDVAVAPTQWQRQTYPAEFQDKIIALHDGIDVAGITKTAEETALPALPFLDAPDTEVVTFVARSLEPLRGFHIFMRAVSKLLKQRPRAHIYVVGDSELGKAYGQPPQGQKTWKDKLLRELAGELDLARIHFTGTLPYGEYLALLRRSNAHVYLTYPFVLSWSLLEAMALGKVIIGSRTAPVEEVLKDNADGLLVPFFDSDGLSSRISRVLKSPWLFQGLGHAARRKAQDHYDFRSQIHPKQLDLLRKLNVLQN